MSVYTDLFTYLDAQWSDRTKIVLPNTQSAQFSGSYTDSESVLEAVVLKVGAQTRGIPVDSSTLRQEFYILQCNIIGVKDEHFGTVYDHAAQLDSLFQNKTVSQGDYTFYFEEASLGGVIPDESAFVVPWSCPFFIFVD